MFAVGLEFEGRGGRFRHALSIEEGKAHETGIPSFAVGFEGHLDGISLKELIIFLYRGQTVVIRR